MDKFTVDLEKVLDEFEYNESRDESILTPMTNRSLSTSNQQKFITPASLYRRPAFEPIHLSDADFSAAPIPPVNVNFSVQPSFRETFNTNRKDTIGCAIQRDIDINQIDRVEQKSLVFSSSKPFPSASESCDSTKWVIEQPSQPNGDGVTSEGTPDLLDSTTPHRPIINNSSYDVERGQMPDITSMPNATSPSIKKSSIEHPPTFDLIKPQEALPESSYYEGSNSSSPQSQEPSVIENGDKGTVNVILQSMSGAREIVCTGNSGGFLLGLDDNSEGASLNSTDDGALPPVVDVVSILNNPLLDLKLEPLTFNTDDISDSELEEYLEHIAELSEELPLLENGKSPDEDSSTSQPCSAEDASNLNQITTESTEIDAVDTTTISSTDSSIDDNIPVEESIAVIEETINEVAIACEALPSQSSPIPFGDEAPEETAVVANPDPNSEESSIGSDVASNDGLANCLEITIMDGDGPMLSEVTEVYASSSTDSHFAEENETNENIETVEKSTFLPETTAESSIEEQSCEMAVEEAYENPTLVAAAPSRPSSLPLNTKDLTTESEESPTPTHVEGPIQIGTEMRLGKTAPFWIPDTDTELCMQCQLKFTMIRRRHHCRACGLVLCSKCCCLKAPLEYMKFQEARVCQPCFTIIYRGGEDQQFQGRQPNPNNPMEYCSTIPPLQQAASSINQPPPSVLVPSGVLKREGRAKSDVPKQVIFSDGIRPGGDLTELDGPSESRVLPKRPSRRLATIKGNGKSASPVVQRPINPETQSFIPSEPVELPPVVRHENAQLVFLEDVAVIDESPVKYVINYNLFVHVKRVKLQCCVNRECWSICSDGLAVVGQDEVALVLECTEDEKLPPQDVFHFINTLYLEGSKGSTVSDMSFTPSFSSNMLGSKDHGGFLYIRPTFQCTTNLLLPQQPYLIAILVDRWETPWARLFPLRLILRLGAEYRYYPCPLISIRNRPPLYTDVIGHTVMKILVDFRKYSYSLATVRGLLIHMEDRQTTILFPRNRYDQVVRALNNSNDSVLAFGANLSLHADSHLVCIQGTKDENSYLTQAINIHSKPRKVTGASFVVFNGALKAPGLSGKTSIVEDGLMVQLPSASMTSLRTALREMKDFTISCGPNDEETVHLMWSADDTNFNNGVKSVIDGKPLDGVPSIRVHNGTDYGVQRIMRWTEVFILKSEEEKKSRDPLDIRAVSESVARASCLALVQDLESLVKGGIRCLAIRANIHPDSVGYEAGANEITLPQNNMNRLDEELVPVLHQAAILAQDTLILELVFRIIDHP